MPTSSDSLNFDLTVDCQIFYSEYNVHICLYYLRRVGLLELVSPVIIPINRALSDWLHISRAAAKRDRHAPLYFPSF
jgi:hypothetical protein